MSDFVKAAQVFLNNESKNVDEALAFLADKAVELGVANDAEAVLAAFRQREAEGTTGLMEGFAIPHTKKCAAITKAMMCVVKFAGDIEWESMDKKPIRVAIALLVPEGEEGQSHLQILSKVAVMLMDENFRKQILEATSEDEIAKLLNAGLE